jgi:hypothetical protein
VPIHPSTERVAQDRPVLAVLDGVLDRPSDRRRQRDQDRLVALAADPQNPVAVLLAEIAEVRAAGLEDPQPEQP